MICVENLTKSYDGFAAVQGISFSAGPGEVLGFIGPNGAGKTTTIRILATLLDPTSGRAIIGGHDVVEHPERVRAVLGYMPDEFGVYEGITVEEYLDFFGAAFRIPRGRRAGVVKDVMALTDLGEIRGKMVLDLSKGMRRRLGVARLLLNDPKVLLLDEPAGDLDTRARIEIRALLKELGRMGKTILISSHILTELADFCTSLAILERGRLLAFGKIDEILQRLSPSRCAKIRLSMGAQEAAAKCLTVPGVLGAVIEAGGLLVRYEGEIAQTSRILRALIEGGFEVTEVLQERSDLEGIFLRVTEGGLR